MPRNYKRKTNRGGWLEDSMIKALDAVKRKGRKGKGVSIKRKKVSYILESESSEEEEEGTECLFCTEIFSKDNMGELWMKCCECQKWGHQACAGINSDDPDKFTCDLCVRTLRKNV